MKRDLPGRPIARDSAFPSSRSPVPNNNDWILIERIAATRRPVIVSTGGSSLKDIADMVTFFANRNIPLAINECVSIYPSENSELERNQIDFLRNRSTGNVVGFSTHEYNDWEGSTMIA